VGEVDGGRRSRWEEVPVLYLRWPAVQSSARATTHPQSHGPAQASAATLAH